MKITNNLHRFRSWLKQCEKNTFYNIEIANKFESLLKVQASIHRFHKGRFDGCTDEDFKNAYANIMLTYKLPAGDIYKSKPEGDCIQLQKAKVISGPKRRGFMPYLIGKSRWMWAEEIEYMRAHGYEIITSSETYWMKVYDFSPFARNYIDMVERNPSKEAKQILICLFGYFAYRVRPDSVRNKDGKRSHYKTFNNFFAISYVYLKTRIAVSERCLKLSADNCKIIAISTDGIIYKPLDRAPIYNGILPYKQQLIPTCVYLRQGVYAYFDEKEEIIKYAIQGVKNAPFIPGTIKQWLDEREMKFIIGQCKLD